MVVTEDRAEMIAQAAGPGSGVFAAIADEDVARGCSRNR
jgi:hypothetical protein